MPATYTARLSLARSISEYASRCRRAALTRKHASGPVKRGPDVVFPVRLPYFYEKTRPTTHESISSVARPSHGGGHACRPKPDARLRNRVRYFQNRTAQRDHGREGRPGRPRHADRRRLGTHGRHGRHSPSRQYFPAQAAGQPSASATVTAKWPVTRRSGNWETSKPRSC